MSTEYRWTSITHEDVQAWTDLTNHLGEVDGTEEFYSVADMAEELGGYGLEPKEDTWAVWDGEQMVGCAMISVGDNPNDEGKIRCNILGGVHQDHRGAGIGRELMDRAEARAGAKAAAKHPDHDSFWRVGSGLEGSSAQRMLTARGYEVVRYFNHVVRPLQESPVTAPEGVTLRPVTDADEAAVLQAHRAAFKDHWGSAPMSQERWHHYWTGRSSRHDQATVAVDDADGTVLTYVLTGQWVDRELYVNLLGTIPSARGRGLARAALRRTIDAGARSGKYDVIELEVDSDSLTGATRMYDDLGFTLKNTTATMQRDAH